MRTRREVARLVARNPFRGREGASILFLGRRPGRTKRRAFLELDLEPPRSELHGRAVFFVYPTRRRGQRGTLDLERALGVRGTARSARVVERVLARMSGGPSKGRG